MKILMMCRLYCPHVGGVEKHVQKISQSLSLRGHRITIVCEKHDPQLPDFEAKRGVEIYRIWGSDKWAIWKWWLQHLNLIKDADIIHIHDVFFWFLPFRLPFWHKKVYMTFHGWEGIYPVPWRNKLQHKIAEKLSRGNICVGSYLTKWYGTKPDFITYGAA